MSGDEMDNLITRIRGGVITHLKTLAGQDLAVWDDRERLEIQWHCEAILAKLGESLPTAS